MDKLVKIFNQLIDYKMSPHFGEILLDCRLIGRNGGIRGYRYDLLFMFDHEYNNFAIQQESVLKSCDELFNWVDLTSLTDDLSIVIMNKFGNNRHYSYFGLMDEVNGKGFSYNGYQYMHQHPKYSQYMEWKHDKEIREMREKMEREFGSKTGIMVERNKTLVQLIEEPKKRKFLFW